MAKFDSKGFQEEVGTRLMMARKLSRLTQAALAERLGMPRATYANMEKGRQRIPVDIIWRVWRVTGCRITQLMPEPTPLSTEKPK